MLIIERLSITGANFMNAGMSIGFPAVTAFSGFCHQLVREYRKQSGAPATLRRFGVILHQSEMRAYGTYKNILTAKRGLYDGSTPPSADRAHYFFTPPSEVSPQGNLTVSLILDIDFDHKAVAFFEQRDQGSNILPSRAMGGVIAACGRMRLVTDAETAVRKLPSGWALCDMTDEISHGDDALEELFRALGAGRGSRYLAPLQTGWRAISSGADRGGRGGDIPHYFVEPIVGLGEFVRKHLALANGLDAILWRPSIDKEAGIFHCAI